MKIKANPKTELAQLRKLLADCDVRYSPKSSDEYDYYFVFGKSWIPEMRGEIALRVERFFITDRAKYKDAWPFTVRSIFSMDYRNNKLDFYNSYNHVNGVKSLVTYFNHFKQAIVAIRNATKCLEKI